MHSTARRFLPVSALGLALVAPLAAQLQPATAAVSSSNFIVDSAAITKAQVGKNVEIRVTPAAGSTIDCKSLTLQSLSGTATAGLAIDWTASGCWTGGANLVTKASSKLVGKKVRAAGTVSGSTLKLAATTTVGTAKAVPATVQLPKAAAALPNRFGVSTTSAALPAKAKGTEISMRLTPTAGAQLDCDTMQVQYLDAKGTWTKVAFNAQKSGCWTGGANVVIPVTQALVGKQVRVVAEAKRVGTASPVFAAEYVQSGVRTPAAVVASKLAAAPKPTATPTPSAKPTVKPTATPKPTTTPKPTAAPTATPKPTTPAKPATGAVTTLSGLPRVAWEGGNEYYKSIPAAVKGGWTSPDHFPIGVWWGGGSTDAEIQADKKLGINTYIVTNPGMDASLFSRNGVSYIGEGTNNMKRDDPAWVGDYLDDEVDGRYSPTEGHKHLSEIAAKLPDSDKIRYANFTGMMIAWHKSNPTWNQAANDYASKYTDVMSLDTYWYSSNQCDWDEVQGHAYQVPFTKANCRTAQNYGRSVESMRWRDAQDGKLQPVWNFIENIDVTVNGTSHHDLTPAEVKAAAMSSIINEARGLLWFNTSFGGKCESGNALRDAQRADYACRDTVMAMGEVNNLIKGLAPVLNTQSYEWNFGKDLETMLKVHNGAAYVFAMSTDTVAPGQRTFTVPAELKGRKIEVVGENRTITPKADGTFTDNFASLNTYHVYKIA